MNKKLLLGMFAAAGMLLATSCSKEEQDVVQSGNEAQVTFSLEVEGAIATRAISDGTGAKKLVYAVYNAQGQLINTIANADINGQIVDNSAFDNGLTDNVTITLAKGQQYTVAFWAQNPNCTAYTTTDLKNVTVDYAGLNNDETRDAFFKAETFTVTGNATIDVVLKRPFAQINVGVTKADWDAAVASGVTITESKVVIKNAATSINLLDGTVSGEQVVEYDFAAIPTDPATLEVDVDRNGTIAEDEKYKYLSMCYILTDNGAEKTTLEADGLQFTFKSGGEDIVFDEGLHAVPVQRNWRTNILGKLLTGDIQFNIVIDEIFYNDYNYPEFREVANGVKYDAATRTYYLYSAAGLEWLSTETNTNNNQFSGYTVKLTSDVDLNNVAWTPIGQSNTFNGTFDGGNNTISNLTVSGDNTNVGLFGKVIGTIKNVKIANVNLAGSHYVGGIVGYIYGNIENCHVDGGDIKVSVKDGDNGDKAGGIAGYVGEGSYTLSGNTVKNLRVEAYRDVAGIAGCIQTGAKVENNTVDKVTVIANMLQDGGKTLADANADKVVGRNIANADLSTNTTNNVTVTIYGIDSNNIATVGNDAGVTYAINKGTTTISLTPGTYIIPDEAQGKTLTFIGTGNPKDTKIATQDDGSYEGCDYSLDGATVTFENITINTDSETYTGYARCSGTYKNCVINGTYTLYGDSKFENCTFNVSGDVYNIWTWGAKNMEFDRCTFNSDGKALLLYQEGTNTINLTVKDCIFNDNGGLTAKKAAIEIGDAPYGATPTYNVTVSGTTVNGYEINDEGINTGTTLWGNKNSMPADRLNVTVDGVVVY